MNKNIVPGLGLCILLAAAGILLASLTGLLGGVTFSLITGIIAGNVIPNKEKLKPGIHFTDKKVLPFTIALLGTELGFASMLELGYTPLLLIILLVISTILAGFFAGRLFGLSKKGSLLLGCGNAVCGSSAIMSVKKVIGSSDDDTGLSIAAVNFMGTIGLFILPVAAALMGLNDEKSAGLIGGVLQAVGHVVAAGFSVNDDVGTLALIIKMTRVLMLGPVIFFLGLFYRKNPGKAEDSLVGNITRYVPLFIIGFFLMAVIANTGLLPEGLVSFIKQAASILLAISMAGIGMNIDLRTIKKQGPKFLTVEIVIMVFQVAAATAMVLLFW